MNTRSWGSGATLGIIGFRLVTREDVRSWDRSHAVLETSLVTTGGRVIMGKIARGLGDLTCKVDDRAIRAHYPGDRVRPGGNKSTLSWG